MSGARPQLDDRPMGQTLAETGLLVLRNHIDADLLGSVTDSSRAAFALPLDAKLACEGPRDGSQRGYLRFRTALPDGREALDRKEAWHARPEGHRFLNLFPFDVPAFGPAVLALIDRLEVVTGRVMDAVGAQLGREPGSYAPRIEDGDSLFRVNHYPPHEGDTAPRFAAHQDFDLITLIFGADASGLEIQERRRTWRQIEAAPTDVVVIVGDLLEIESQGTVRATPHRVVTPASSNVGRISMVYFVSPRPEVELRPGVTAADVVDARLRQAGYA